MKGTDWNHTVRNWRPSEPPRHLDPYVYETLKKLNQFVTQAQAGFARLDRGTTTDGSSAQIGATDHGELDGLVPEGADGNDDHSQYLLLSGRSGGQSILGDSATSGTSTTPVLTLANFNLNTSSGAQRITLRGGGASQGDITIETPQLSVKERAAATAHFNVLPTASLVRMSHNGTATFTGQSADGHAVMISSTGNAAVGDHNLILRARSGQTGDFLRIENSASTRLSYIRASDGAFIGPVVPTAGTIDHDLLNGLADDDHLQYILGDSSSRATGQHIGSGTKPTGGTTGDFSTFGRLNVGTSTFESDAYATHPQVNFKKDLDMVVGGSGLNAHRFLLNLTGSGAATGTATGILLNVVGGTSLSSGTMNLYGISVISSTTVAAGVTATIRGLSFAPSLDGAGTLDSLIGGEFFANASTTAGATSTNVIAVKALVSNRASVTTNLIGVQAIGSGGTILAAVTQATAFDVGSSFANDADVVTWSGLRISTGITAAIANKWSLDLTNTTTNMGSRIAHKIALGWNPATVAAITARLMLAAGTATASTAPLKFQTGTSLTAAEAGAVEFTTDDLFFTITTGAARKKFVLDDGTALTSGRVPFATTNGRLTDDTDLTFATDTLSATKVAMSSLTSGRVPFATTAGLLVDDADFTFATDTLTVTKIAATQFTGNITIADAINIITNGTTGTKIATTTSQKIGFWNAAPIVQPTTAVTAATFVTNTSLIANDSATFDGYTIGQVVAALRNAGLLA